MLGKLFLSRHTNLPWFGVLLLLLLSGAAGAQSIDPNAPSPIRNNNLLGHIAARDIGDSRLTDHYYAFAGIPGDVVITVQSRNLNGDIDIFTAGTMRPLLKLTLYAESTTPVTKSIYLRKREDLILRIEARSPNDDEGTYQIFFGGSFVAIVGGPDNDESEESAAATSTSGDSKAKRVSSVGARLPEPEVPVAEVTATPAPTPEPKPSAAPENVAPAKPKKEESAANPTPTRTPSRTRRPTTRRTTTATTAKPKEAEKTVAEDTKPKEEKPEDTEPAKSETIKAKPPSRTTGRRNTTASRTTKPAAKPAAPEPEPESGPRLVIETNDGTLINRSMSSVRRVIVENGQIVVTGKDGKIDRIPLANVLRMSIAP